MDGLAHLKLALRLACRFFLVFGFRRIRRYDKFGYRCLKLDIVGTGFFSRLDQTARHVYVAVVVHAGFSYYYSVMTHKILLSG